MGTALNHFEPLCREASLHVMIFFLCYATCRNYPDIIELFLLVFRLESVQLILFPN